jgi:hypothetical protein
LKISEEGDKRLSSTMAESGLQKYLESFKSIKGLGASVGVLLPGFVYFTNYAPPYFPGIALLTAAFATATILITYYYSPAQVHGPSDTLPPMVRMATRVFIVSVLLLLAYTVLLYLCTVPIPGTTQRIQIGFYNFDWSLTRYGGHVKAANPVATPANWLSDESWSTDAPAKIWSSWAIHLSGILMTVVFIFTFVLWTFGWSLIAKQKAISD